MSLKFRRVIADPIFQTNCFLVGCPDTNEGILIDAGIDIGKISQAAGEEGIKIQAIVNTHGHIDHIAGAAQAKKVFDAPFFIHEGDRFLVEKANEKAAFWGLPPIEIPEVDRWLEEGDSVKFGETALKVVHTPGHSPGGICLLNEGHAFVGDALFAGSIGRTDFEGGDYDILISSIREKILTLPHDTVLHPGHGPDTTVAQEMAGNPFLQ